MKPVPAKPEPQPEKADKIDKYVDNTGKERKEQARRKVIEEMRKRAMEMDKKFK